MQITSQIWDLSGQPQFKVVRQHFYRGARGVVYMFDVSRRETFENLEKWRKEVTETLPDPPCILIGNKIDLPRHIDEEEAREYALSFEAQYFETSVLENINVQQSMDKINEIIFVKQEIVKESINSQNISSYSEDIIQPRTQCPATSNPSKCFFPEHSFSMFNKH